METVFLSHSFADPDRELLIAVTELIESHSLRIVTGRDLGGQLIIEEVRKRIWACDALVGIATPRTPLPSGGYATHPWVHDEMIMAKDGNKRCIILQHDEVRQGGADQENERIDYDPSKPLAALVKLSRTVGLWKRDSGRKLKALVLPMIVAEKLARERDDAVCEFRTYDSDGKPGMWRGAKLVPMVGGPVVQISGLQDDVLFELRVKLGKQTWRSEAMTSITHVELKQRKGSSK